MSEKELVEELERSVIRVGLRPVLTLLVDWIGRGFFLEVLENVQDAIAEEGMIHERETVQHTH